MAQNRGGPFLILAVVLGLAAAAVVFLYLNQQSAANVTARQTRPVVVAANDLTFGTKLERNMLKVVNYPKDSVPPNAYSSLDSVEGQTTKIFLAAKEPVLSSKLSTIGGGLSMMVRPAMRASSVTVNLVSSVSGFVVPGDRVDVLVTIDRTSTGGATDQAFTQTILQNIEVLAAGVKTEQKDQENKPNTDLQTVTLLVDPPAAQKMALAMHEGRIHLTLRNPEDADTLSALAAANTNELIGKRPPVAGPPRARASAPRVVYRDVPAPPAEPAKPPKVTVIRAGKQEEKIPANADK
ncbi:MAG: Flp pilus assembly protein CpaB [Candidatus Eiseniibacteriota bacterium]